MQLFLKNLFALLVLFGFSVGALAQPMDASGVELESMSAEELEALYDFDLQTGWFEADDLNLYLPESYMALNAELPPLSDAVVGSVPMRLQYYALSYADQTGIQPAALNGRIVGGESADFPWQVGLILPGYPTAQGQFCGGSIINESWILTAAHCVDSSAPGSFRVFMGSHDLANGGSLHEVVTIMLHPGWNSSTMENDIALVQLVAPVTFDGEQTAVAMGNASDEATLAAPGTLLTVSGWGATSEGGNGSRTLRKVVVPVVDFGQCNSAAFYNGSIKTSMICAGVGGQDSCQGDSGGPLVALPDSRDPVQFGVVSWGYGCARPNKPGVYTRVAEYADWIDQNTN